MAVILAIRLRDARLLASLSVMSKEVPANSLRRRRGRTGLMAICGLLLIPLGLGILMELRGRGATGGPIVISVVVMLLGLALFAAGAILLRRLGRQ